MEEPEPAGRLVIIGTGHVFHIRQAVHDAVVALRPDTVFVELDQGRLQALVERRRGIVRPPAGNWFHRRLQSFQEGIAKAYGAEAGDEMLAAVEGAHAVGAKAMLVDRRVDITLRRAMRELTMRERLRFLGMIVAGAFKNLRPRRGGAKAAVEAEMKRYVQDPERALEELGRQFPTVRRVVIDERDDFMATRIRGGLAGITLGLAVVGDGHVPGLLRLLDGIEVETYRLQDVRDGRLPKRSPDDTGHVSFSFDVSGGQ